MVTALRHGVALLAAALLALAPDRAPAATGAELSDYEAKAQYGFFTADANALRGLARTVRTLGESEDRLALYHYAHVQFRLLQLGARTEDERLRRDAIAAGEACVDALDRAIARDPRFAEGLALQGVCHAYLARLSTLKSITSAPRSLSRTREAARLDPHNPRVLLAQATTLYFLPAALGGDRARAPELFQRAADGFERLAPRREGEPTWGAAEAWLFVGRVREEGGDALAARDAYDRALIVAPEFADAQARRRGLGAARR